MEGANPEPELRVADRTEASATATLEPEIRSGLAAQVERALARRSLSGAMVYFVVVLVIAFSTPYHKDHGPTLLAAGCVTLLLGLLRLLSARRLLALPAGTPTRAAPALIFALYATFAVWGVFCGWTVFLYPGQWTSMFLLLNTAALAGGMSSSLAPAIGLASRCLIILCAPTIGAAMAVGGTEHVALAAVTCLYLIFLIAQARANWRSFWDASVAAEREKLRGSAARKRAERERAILVAAIEQAAEEILITDLEGNIQYCNPAFEKHTGYARAEALGRNPRFLRSGKQDAGFYETLWTTIRSGRVWSGRFTNQRKDGTLYEAEGTISPIRDPSGKPAGYVSARHDVTERLRMESRLRQAQKMEAIGRLAAGIAHDFNNLLTVISGYSAVLEEEIEDGPRREYAKEIRKSAERAARLTRQLLSFSRKQITHPRPMELNALLADMQRMLERLLGEDIKVTIAPAPELGLVRADPDQMSQIVINLAANARDAMPRGGRFTIRTENAELAEKPSEEAKLFPGPAVLLSVSDTGQGMSEETRQHLFEPFFTTKEKGRGTGLGLSTVYGIVQQSNGYIEVQSEPGSGTCFNIYLPRIEDAVAEPEAPRGAAADLRGSETVLVVEDQDEVRKLMITALESYGYRVVEAAGGRAALEQAERHPRKIDLLLTDVIMPDMNGKELADRLVPLRPGMKVLFTSGYSGEVIAHRGVLDNNVAYLPKPFTPDTLVAKVREVLGPEAA